MESKKQTKKDVINISGKEIKLVDSIDPNFGEKVFNPQSLAEYYWLAEELRKENTLFDSRNPLKILFDNINFSLQVVIDLILTLRRFVKQSEKQSELLATSCFFSQTNQLGQTITHFVKKTPKVKNIYDETILDMPNAGRFRRTFKRTKLYSIGLYCEVDFGWYLDAYCIKIALETLNKYMLHSEIIDNKLYKTKLDYQSFYDNTNWPKNPESAFFHCTGWSALEVAHKFISEIFYRTFEFEDEFALKHDNCESIENSRKKNGKMGVIDGFSGLIVYDDIGKLSKEDIEYLYKYHSPPDQTLNTMPDPFNLGIKTKKGETEKKGDKKISYHGTAKGLFEYMEAILPISAWSDISLVGEINRTLTKIQYEYAEATKTEPKNAGGTSSKVGDTKIENTLTGEALALAMLVKHPDWSDRKIAKAVSVNRTTLYDWPKFKKAKEALKQGKNNLPKGSKNSETGDIEAWDEKD